MKSARERAEEVLRALGDAAPSDYPERVTALLERHLKEHARDQRHLCAHWLNVAAGVDYVRHLDAAVRNAPAPGEGQ